MAAERNVEIADSFRRGGEWRHRRTTSPMNLMLVQ